MAIGFLECAGYAAVLYAMDKACKAAEIKIIGIDTINSKDADAFIPLTSQAKFEGGTEDVRTACKYAEAAALMLEGPGEVLAEVIERPESGTRSLSRISKIRLKEDNLEEKKGSIGVLEINYFTNTVIVLDRALKAADVDILDCQKRLGGRMCYIILQGRTSEVEAAVQAAREAERIVGKYNIKTAIAIHNPHPEIIKVLNNNYIHKKIKGGNILWQKQM